MIKEQLRILKKLGTKAMQDYLMRVKGLVESLSSVGETLTKNASVDYILGGLGSEYICVYTIVRSRKSTFFEELIDLMISEE